MMPTAKKLPSGSWRCQVFSHMENGKRKYRSFTCSDTSIKGKRTCEAMAAEWASNKEILAQSSTVMTLSDAMTEYIDQRVNIMSPRTIDDYRRYQKRYYDSIIDKRIDVISSSDLQGIVNTLAVDHSQKTVCNIYGFVHTVLTTYQKDRAFNVDLPKKQKVQRYIPTEEDIKKILDASAGTVMELPILLAVFGPMRRGEISALSVDDIDGNVVHVHRNAVKKAKDEWVIKSPKSYAGDRYITYPDFVAAKFPKTDPVVAICPDTITKNFIILRKSLGLPEYRFHDLRHFSASFQLASGSDESTVMQRGGWGDARTLREVYQHVVEEKARKNNEKVNAAFEQFS